MPCSNECCYAGCGFSSSGKHLLRLGRCQLHFVGSGHCSRGPASLADGEAKMKTRRPQASQKTVAVMPYVNAKGRVDILIRRLSEFAVRKLEQRTNMPGIWDNFAKPIVEEKVQEYEGMG